jgi:hypothetical protein
MIVKIFMFLINIPLGILLLLLATLGFDVLHVCLHRLAQSSNSLLKKIGALHATHHQFLDTNLRIHENLVASNVFRHVIPEFIVQLLVTLAMIPIFPMMAVAVALAIELAVFVFIMWGKPGFDVNHKHIKQLKAYKPLYFCVPEYHLLHHAYPVAYFSSWIKTLDHLLCTGTALQGRRVLLTETESEFARAAINELQQAGAIINCLNTETSQKNQLTDAVLKQADILVLCHKPLTDSDYSDLAERFSRLQLHRRLPVEVWALADTNERSGFAKKLSGREDFIYRHLVAEGYSSDSAQAKKLLKGVRRGFNYVPVRYNLATLKHYWQFVAR